MSLDSQNFWEIVTRKTVQSPLVGKKCFTYRRTLNRHIALIDCGRCFIMANIKGSSTISLLFVAFQFTVLAFWSLKFLLQSDLPCHKATKIGLSQACCDGSKGPTIWGLVCNGDVAGDTPGGACEANEVLQSGAFGGSKPFDSGPTCYAPAHCQLQT